MEINVKSCCANRTIWCWNGQYGITREEEMNCNGDEMYEESVYEVAGLN